MNSMYINENSKVIVQGITGKQGMFHTQIMLNYGTKLLLGLHLEREVKKYMVFQFIMK